MTGFVRFSRIYLITDFTLVADQQFVVECGYSLDCKEGHMKKIRLSVCLSVCLFAFEVKRTSV